MRSETPMTDQELDALLVSAFGAMGAPEEAVDSVRESVSESYVDAVPKKAAPSRSPRFTRVQRGVYRLRMAATLAACLALGAVGFGGYTAWADVVTVIGVDADPAIELSVNRFDVVVAAKGVNSDGAALLDEVDVVGKPCPDALSAIMACDTVRALSDSGDSDPVTFSVVSLKGSSSSSCSEHVAAAAEASGCSYICCDAESEEYRQASSLGMTVGKYRLYEQLVELGCDITPEQASGMSMRQLRDMVEDAGGQVSRPNSHQGAHQGEGQKFGSHGEGWGGKHGEGSAHGAGQGHGASSE